MANGTWHLDSTHCLNVRTTEGNFDAYRVHPTGDARGAIVVLHEVFGVNADLRATCAELADAGYLAICPDLFWRLEPHVDLSVNSYTDWQRGLALYSSFDIEAGVRDVASTVDAARPSVRAGHRVGVMGFCLGGLLTFLTAARTRVDAAVAFHGARTEEFLGEAIDIDAPLQMHLAEEDEFIPRAAQQTIVSALAAYPKIEVFSYAGCHHAFSRHGGEHFDAGAARLSRSRTLSFFDRHLD